MKAYDSSELFNYFCNSLSCPDVSDAHFPVVAITVDTLVSCVHFPEDTPVKWLAYKSLAVNLSDLASMGSSPTGFTVGLILPEWDEAWLENFGTGLQKLQSRWGLELLGCDVCRGPLSVTIQAQGGLKPDEGLRRSGARPGDRIFVTGTLGDAACALPYYLDNKPLPERYHDFLQRRFHCPEPRVAAGLLLVDIASAAIDISDGLAADLGHILEESQVGAVLHIDKLPSSAAVKSLLNEEQRRRCQLGGGDDYELCFTVPVENISLLKERFAELGLECTWVGEIVEGDSVGYRIKNSEVKMDIRSYDHFPVRAGLNT